MLKSGYVIVVPVRGIVEGLMITNESNAPKPLDLPHDLESHDAVVEFIIKEAENKGFKVTRATSAIIIIEDQ